MDAHPRIQPRYLDGFRPGRRFGLWIWPPDGVAVRGGILAVPPQGDEARLSRRALVDQAQRLARLGWVTLLFDLYGTGDSEGESEEASLAIWRADMLTATRLVRDEVEGPFVLWGTRIGVALALDVAIALDQIVSALVLWQPDAGDGLPGLGDGGVPEFRPELLRDLAELALEAPRIGEHGMPSHILIVAWEPGVAGEPDLTRLSEAWRRDGHAVAIAAVDAAPFWTTPGHGAPAAACEATETFLRGDDALA